MSMYLEGSVVINPTEDPEKDLRCIFNIFPDCDTVVTDVGIEFSTGNLDRFVEILTEQQIRDTALMVIGRELEGDTARFHLNKQAAFMGYINFTDGDSTLGDLSILVREGSRDLIEVIRPVLD